MIRAYRDEDLEPLLDVWYRASRSAHPFLDEAFLERERRTIATVFMPKAQTWVYRRGADLLGFISLLDDEIGGLFVDPAAQGQGIGRALLDHVRSLHQELEVDVFKANDRGCRFYAAMGFVVVGERLDEETGQLVLRMRLVGG